ncbi:MAG: glycosyltransferase family 39 protein [Acidobacteria bacterium]|nr:glycosyltransferase family 39 protein [Acidobacteriota bacterium]
MPRVALAFVVLLAIVTCFAGLGRAAIADSDEAFYAQAAREMIAGGDWLTPHYNDEYRFQKPILFYWLVAVSYLIGGINEAAARAPSALAGVGLTLITFWSARRWYDTSTAILAAAIVCSAFGYPSMARQSLPDLPLTFFITLAIWTGIEGLLVPVRAEFVPSLHHTLVGHITRRRWLLWSAGATAGAFLTKGPVGIALPLLVVTPLLIWECRRVGPSSVMRQIPWRDLAFALLVFVAIATPWYAGMAARHGTWYLQHFFLGENLERFATDRFNAPRPFWFYVPVILTGMLPWTPFVILWIAPAIETFRRRRAIGRVELRLAAWGVLPLLFYTLSIGKQPRYVLPVFPPLAMLLAQVIRRAILGAGARPNASLQSRLLVGSGVAAGAVILGTAIAVSLLAPLLVDADPRWIGPAIAIIGLSGFATIFAAAVSKRALPFVTALCAAVTFVALQLTVFSGPGPEAVERMGDLVRVHRTAGEPVGSYGVFVRNLIFYTGVRQTDIWSDKRMIDFLQMPERVLCVVPKDAAERVPFPVVTLGEVSYFNPVALKPRMLWRPDPERDLATALLIANR